MTQTYIFLAALVISAAIGLYGWSLYKKEQENKPSTSIQGNLETNRVFDEQSAQRD
ncbi:hypothetical protein wVul_1733 [Wolbachia endosymbiont of Armadillidium vulgare str. wVulC]|uniref:Uncharacterized protein n=1 Tax=Wolbachia endosymbiont of Armadillidium arcangelii TaxID=3158571 RepID=A0AAU7Q363_9RICK|nr:hypothetical protein [Wolbachia endosymbiont of Armadillidium vulgare]KLT21988.1 hypothetical protein wVul_1733 [Wolbachia endosymbiont of Armadillidium vulgare str. wVulC]OJH30643.1 hypothetical protein Wxf_02972 [Armadillidium vulgare] [Wolbachia endosymbiont of Armadillidium vulgare]